jgi:tyrosine-protein phosphatase YwqE
MLQFFRKQPTLDSYAFLGVDMHAHWLPGIDDGAPDLATSLQLLRQLQDLGYRELWATPHVMADLYPNTPAIIHEKLAEVREAAHAAGLDLALHAAAEYLLDEGFADKLNKGELLTLPGKKVLVELSFVSAPPHLEEVLFQLQAAGYGIILAHPERYLYLRDDFARYEKLHRRGLAFQLNLLSLTGYYGEPIRENAQRLLKAGLVDYLGTDMHHERHLNGLAAVLRDRKLSRLLLSQDWKNRSIVQKFDR